MKKHELLKYAYDTYPKGTKCEWTDIYFVSDGNYRFIADGRIVDGNDRAVWNTLKWAEIIPEKPTSILDGKVAIAVNNEREFKLLMEHYKGKGWASLCGDLKDDEYNRHGVISVSYHNKFHYHNKYTFKGNELHNIGYKIIHFQDFAKESGIEVPVFVMKSEDGIDLYVGDNYHRAWYSNDVFQEWRLDYCKDLRENHAVVTGVDKAKAFSTKEAAEKWIKEQNKPKEVVLNLDGAKVVVNDKVRITNNIRTLTFDFSDLEQIYAAYKSLQ